MFGGVLGAMFGSILNVLPAIKDIIETFRGSRKERDANVHSEQVSLNEAYSKEFSYSANNRNWFDRVVDGLNRLPRPLFAFMAAGTFIWCAVDPSGFAVSMTALRTMPPDAWLSIQLVLSFFFGGRLLSTMLEKGAGAPVKALTLPQYQEEIRAGSAARARSASGENKVIADWKRKATESVN